MAVTKLKNMRSEEEKKSRSRVRRVTLHFLRNTNLHGIPNVLSAPHRCIKIFWIILSIVMLGVLIAHTTYVVKKFFSYPTKVSIRIKHPREVPFPAVTICNQNPIERSRLTDADWGRIAELDKSVNCLAVNNLANKPNLRPEKLLQRYSNATRRCNQTQQRTKRQVNPTTLATIVSIPSTTASYLTPTVVTSYLSPTMPPTMPPTTSLEVDVATAVATTLSPLLATTPSHWAVTKLPYVNAGSSTTPYYNYWPDYDYGSGSGTAQEAEHEKNNIAETEGFAALAKYEDKLELLLNSNNSDLTDVTNILSPNYAELFADTNYTSQTQLTNLVRECSFDRKHCNIRIFDSNSTNRNELTNAPFRSYMTGQYGRCFSFGSTGDISRKFAKPFVQITSRSGSDYGLRLTININASEYIGMFAPQYGIRVVIHEPTVMPVVFEAFNVPVGALTAVGIRRRVTNRLPHPYESNCWNDIPDDYMIDAKEQKNGESHEAAGYTYKFCRSTCLNTRIHENCSCVKELSYYEDSNLDLLPQVCDVFNATERECMINVSANVHVFRSYCDCQQACKENRYERSLSTVPWPTLEYTHLILNNFAGGRPLWDDFNADDDWANLGQRDCLKSMVSIWDAHHSTDKERSTYGGSVGTSNEKGNPNEEGCNSISKSLLRLHVYFEELNFDVIEESPEYKLDSLGSEIGGILGLYLGLSIAAIFEVIQYFILLVFGRDHHNFE